MSSVGLVSPNGVGASAQRHGFCQRCGDPVSGKVRCSRCGGTCKEPRVLSTHALPAAKKQDPWAHRYVHANSSLPPADELERDEYTHDQPPPLSPKRASYDPALGFGMPSRISHDLRSSALAKPHTQVVQDGAMLSVGAAGGEEAPRRASQDYTAPVVKGSDGVLSKVCGSLVEPAATRNRWACADCAAVFARDSTLYAAPTSSAAHDPAYYCRDCYASRYSLGACAACGRAVLGSTKQDGTYVKATAGIWHGRCWKCSACDKAKKDGVEVLVGMDGKPTCESCFDRPRRKPAGEPTHATPQASREGLPDVRRLTRVTNARSGPMGATIAELTKKLGQQTVASPRIPFSSRSGSNTSLPTSSSSTSSLDAAQAAGKPAGMVRSGSLSGSPPKPRPLTAAFRDGLNLAAFQPSFGGEALDERVHRRDSRSRSVSPVKRPGWRTTPSSDSTVQVSAKVPGSPALAPTVGAAGSQRLSIGVPDPGRRLTSSGFPRPLNDPGAEAGGRSEPVQGEKPSDGLDAIPGALEAAEGSVRCAVCGQLPFEGLRRGEEVVMVTLPGEVHMHADCFRCAVCAQTIDGAKTFVRLEAEAGRAVAPGLQAYAHPHCSPAIRLHVVRPAAGEVEGQQRSYRSSLEPSSAAMSREAGSRSHATHQRELKPSPVPSPATSMRDRTNARPTILPKAEVDEVGTVRRFQPTAGAAPPTRSTILSTSSPRTPAANPAAGIFSRLSTLSTSPNTNLPTRATPSTSPTPATSARLAGVGRFGGMQCCALCGDKLSSLESVLGPRGTQWHRSCLVCRAPVQKHNDIWSYRKPAPLFCAKKLDSGAKVNHAGEVRCRDCFDRESAAFRISS